MNNTIAHVAPAIILFSLHLQPQACHAVDPDQRTVVNGGLPLDKVSPRLTGKKYGAAIRMPVSIISGAGTRWKEVAPGELNGTYTCQRVDNHISISLLVENGC